MAHQGSPKVPWDSLPGDKEKKHETIITSSPYTYQIEMKGAVDGVMTRMPISYIAYHQGWQPNRLLRLENIGEKDVVNPWITINDKRNWRTLNDIVNEAIAGCTTDGEKARVLWEYQRTHRFHACTFDTEASDAVKLYNVYGYSRCGNDAAVLRDLWREAGLNTRFGLPVGHSVAEAFYDGEFHLLDADQHVIYLRGDNKTIASEAEVVRDHDLIKRTHNYGIISEYDSSHLSEFVASLYGSKRERNIKERIKHTIKHTMIYYTDNIRELFGIRRRLDLPTKHTMNYTLRPGESIEWRWDHIGKQYTVGIDEGKGDLDLLVKWGKTAYDNMRNGKMRYTPDFEKPFYRKGVASWTNITAVDDDGKRPALHPREKGIPSQVTWKIASPYIIVGGKINAHFRRFSERDVLKINLSRDFESWENIWTADKVGFFEQEIVFDEKLSLPKNPQYQYYLQIEMQADMKPTDVEIDRISFESDIQMSLLSLPDLEVGRNEVKYISETKGQQKVRITHNWIERTDWHPPAAPRLTTPANGSTVEGTQILFQWDPSSYPDGDKICDYHIQLCDREDMRYPLSPNFDKLVSRTASLGKNEWTVPFVGLLNPDTEYYWHVRAKNDKGVWGEWSKPFLFKCIAPGVPLNVKATFDPKTATGTLTWLANHNGRSPVAFKVYGSDEKGFTASDTEYPVLVGKGFCVNMDDFNGKNKMSGFNDVKTPVGNLNVSLSPANLITTTNELRLVVVGPEMKLPNTNKAFYRVVAVDEKGNMSGPSDYAEFPRPFIFIYTLPSTKVASGQLYEYQPAAIASIGDLKCQEGYKIAFWDREILTFSLSNAAEWLEVDVTTGKISGTPPPYAIGKHEVILRVTNNKGGTGEQKFVLEVTNG